jgi:hypothetical protein
MGRGILKKKKSLKMMYLGQVVKELSRVQAELKAIKEDPQSVVGNFIGQFNETINQNQRLSALACALITQDGGSAKVTREEIEVFRSKRLRIHIATPEDEGEVKFEDAKSYLFTFTATTKEEDEAAEAAAKAAAADPANIPECTDPDCTLPKDLKHKHPTPVPVPIPPGELTLTSNADELTPTSNADEPQSDLAAEAS